MGRVAHVRMPLAAMAATSPYWQALRMWNTKATHGMMSVSSAISVKSQSAPKVS